MPKQRVKITNYYHETNIYLEFTEFFKDVVTISNVLILQSLASLFF